MVVVQPKQQKKQAGDANSLTAILPSSTPLTPGFVVAHAINLIMYGICFHSAFYEFGDATTSMAFYGVYHREPYNQVIHFLGVPLILWTMLIFAAHLPFSNSWKIVSIPGVLPHLFSWATLWTILYMAFYLHIDKVGALLFAPLLYYMYKTSIQWASQDQQLYIQTSGGAAIKEPASSHWMGTGRLLQRALLVHVLSWYSQIHLGHKIIEGAQPASLANLGGALTAAPLFAFYEGIWFMGFRKQFQQVVLDQVDVLTEDLCHNQGADMRVCSTL